MAERDVVLYLHDIICKEKCVLGGSKQAKCYSTTTPAGATNIVVNLGHRSTHHGTFQLLMSSAAEPARTISECDLFYDQYGLQDMNMRCLIQRPEAL